MRTVLAPLALALVIALLAPQPSGAAAAPDRIVIHDAAGDVRGPGATDRDVADVTRARFEVVGSTVEFSVTLPRRIGKREGIQGLVAMMHGGRHDYYVTGNQTRDSVVFAARRTGQRSYVERSGGTSRTFTSAGVLTLTVPLGKFHGRRLVLDKVYAHNGPIGTDHVSRDFVAVAGRALRLR